MTRILNHARSNLIALIALFVALGGTSYAAINLPAGSVGARQIVNRSITPVKFDPSTINGSVRMWARISAAGKVIASKPRAEVFGWSSVYDSGRIGWGRAIPAGCFSLATVDGLRTAGFASVATLNQSRPPAFVVFQTFNNSGQTAAEPLNVAVICP